MNYFIDKWIQANKGYLHVEDKTLNGVMSIRYVVLTNAKGFIKELVLAFDSTGYKSLVNSTSANSLQSFSFESNFEGVLEIIDGMCTVYSSSVEWRAKGFKFSTLDDKFMRSLMDKSKLIIEDIRSVCNCGLFIAKEETMGNRSMLYLADMDNNDMPVLLELNRGINPYITLRHLEIGDHRDLVVSYLDVIKRQLNINYSEVMI